MVMTKLTMIVLAAALLGPQAVRKKQSTPTKGPLAGLPSGAGAHIPKIQALGDGAWLSLGAPDADPKWGRAPGRSYTSKMAYAPDLRVAFLYGEGVHGYVKENGHYMNDFWAYDIHAHRWICIDPGVDTRNFFVKVNPDGFEVDRNGDILPVAQAVHGYEMTSYDPDLRKFIFMPTPSGYWRVKGLVENRPHVAKEAWNWGNRNASPFMYDLASAKWELRKVAGEDRRSNAGDAAFYIPSLRKTLHFTGDSVAAYDYAENSWKPLSPKGKAPRIYDNVACHDTKRDRLYFYGEGLAIYDVPTNAWLDVGTAKTFRAGVRLASWTGHLTYDTANDVVIAIAHYGDFAANRGLYIYDPNKNTWTTEPAAFPGDKWGSGTASNGFYDPELNVHVYHLAGDSRDNGTIWAYRHKRPKKS